MKMKIVKDSITPKLLDMDLKLSGIGNSIAQIAIGDIRQHFIDESGPGGKWEDLSEYTIMKRRKGGAGYRILRDTGQLFQSITSQVSPTAIIVSAHRWSQGQNVAKLMNDGGKNQQGRNVPARPYMWLSRNAKLDIKNMVIEKLKK
jgi:phage gpG-like protein